MLRRFLARSSRARVVFWVLLLAALGLYAAMALWTVPAITSASGGLAPLDARPFGYGVDEARAFLSALTAEGRALYLGPQHRLDNAFPLLYGALLAVAIWRLFGAGSPVLRAVLSVFPLLAAMFDYLENARVRALLMADPDSVPGAMIASANTASLGKWVLGSIAVLTILALIAARLVGRRKEVTE
ncbi:hypothetical protein [Anianabacter salinae]|uniref:hypothetical protein n=1 Tax=Anianabacter salinae TaxID=2851023 RepID=UPI00225E5804|nr:hypothetical protein [Anianabacter salinae]MBV0912733.1 hypothetical protein [Anianabacter salinae]